MFALGNIKTVIVNNLAGKKDVEKENAPAEKCLSMRIVAFVHARIQSAFDRESLPLHKRENE